MMRYFTLLIMIFLAGCGTAQEKKAQKQELEEETAIHKGISGEGDPLFYELVDSSQIFGVEKLNKLNFEDSMQSLYSAIGLKDYGLEYKVFRYGMIGYYNLLQDDQIQPKNLISIIDFTQSSCNKRFYTIDLKNQDIVFNTYVSHGRGTGQDMAKKFSNVPQSYQSSLGFYVTAETYTGSKGYSLRLEGVETGINDKMRDRAIVMHDADYVSEDWIKKYGRIGRSQGCPALPKNISKKVINKIKGKTPIFAYFSDNTYLEASEYLDLDKLMERFEQG